jgi:hypothetical protein
VLPTRARRNVRVGDGIRGLRTAQRPSSYPLYSPEWVQVNSQKPIYAEPCIGPRCSDGFGRFEHSRPTTRTTIYIAHRHIRMRSGQYVAAREHANRRGVSGVKAPWSVRRGTVGLSSVRIEAICRAFPIPLSPSDPQGAVLRLQLPSRRLCRTVEHVAWGRQRNLGLFSRLLRGVWRPYDPL